MIRLVKLILVINLIAGHTWRTRTASVMIIFLDYASCLYDIRSVYWEIVLDLFKDSKIVMYDMKYLVQQEKCRNPPPI
jgi:hypothetical protein